MFPVFLFVWLFIEKLSVCFWSAPEMRIMEQYGISKRRIEQQYVLETIGENGFLGSRGIAMRARGNSSTLLSRRSLGHPVFVLYIRKS